MGLLQMVEKKKEKTVASRHLNHLVINVNEDNFDKKKYDFFLFKYQTIITGTTIERIEIEIEMKKTPSSENI